MPASHFRDARTKFPHDAKAQVHALLLSRPIHDGRANRYLALVLRRAGRDATVLENRFPQLLVEPFMSVHGYGVGALDSGNARRYDAPDSTP